MALLVRVLDDRVSAGATAARDVAAHLRWLLARRPQACMVFAAAPSQAEMLAALVCAPDLDWSRVVAFHMDEYVGLPPGAPQHFGSWLTTNLFDHLPFHQVHTIDPAADPDDAARRYAGSLAAVGALDIVCFGIGVNGHLAFNDPPADLHDPLDARVVVLDDTCRQQQVDDGCFGKLDDVPACAITLTVPRLLRSNRMFGVVSGTDKSAAVRRALYSPVDGGCPATALRTHPSCTLYADQAAAAGLPGHSS